MSHKETIERLKRFLEHAPKNASSALAGWTLEHGVTICGTCAARIMDRGCDIGPRPIPIWEGKVKCDVCEETQS